MQAGMKDLRRALRWLAWVIFPAVVSGAGQPLLGSDSAPPASENCRGGYRPLGLLHDFTLGRQWMISANCAHPEMPRMASLDALDGEKSEAESGKRRIAGGGERISPVSAALRSPHRPEAEMRPQSPKPAALWPGPAAVPPLVAAASRVRLWRRDGAAAIDLAGIALDSGAEGAEIRVRVTTGGQVLRGMVRGPASVELSIRREAGFTGAGQ